MLTKPTSCTFDPYENQKTKELEANTFKTLCLGIVVAGDKVFQESKRNLGKIRQFIDNYSDINVDDLTPENKKQIAQAALEIASLVENFETAAEGLHDFIGDNYIDDIALDALNGTLSFEGCDVNDGWLDADTLEDNARRFDAMRFNKSTEVRAND